MLFHFDFFEKIKGIAKANKGMAKALISTLKPSNEIIQAVTVVPMLAPITTLMDWARLSNPALTKLTTIRVVAEED